MSAWEKAIPIVVFMMFLNGVPYVLMASGVADDMGINPAIGGSDNIEEANSAMENVEGSGGFGETLFSLYTSVSEPVRLMLSVLIGAEIMFLSLGVPEWIVTFLFAPKLVIFGAAIIYVLAGRRL